MANAFPPMPFQTQLVDSRGFMSPPWVAWFREVGVRVSPLATAISDPSSPSASYVQAEAVAVRAAVLSILSVLREHKFIEAS